MLSDRPCLQLTGFYISRDIKPPTPSIPPAWPYDHAMMRDGTVCSVTAPLMQWHTYTHSNWTQMIRLQLMYACVVCMCVCISQENMPQLVCVCVWQPLNWRLCKTLVHHNCDVLARGLSGIKQFPSRYTRRILTSRNCHTHKYKPTHAHALLSCHLSVVSSLAGTILLSRLFIIWLCTSLPAC